MGVTLADTLEQLSRTLGRPHPLLAERGDIPPEAEHVWAYFWQLTSGRSSNGFGPNPISYLEIDTWARLNRVALEPWEVSALRLMDSAFLHAMAHEDEGN